MRKLVIWFCFLGRITLIYMGIYWSAIAFFRDYFSLTGILEEVVARAGQKTEGFRVNITMEQKLRWEDAARKRDMTMSQMIREAVEMYIAVMKRQQELDKSKI